MATIALVVLNTLATSFVVASFIRQVVYHDPVSLGWLLEVFAYTCLSFANLIRVKPCR